ncbi:MAG: T9SS type A sorting domain-containing protein [Chryseobacterium sp.]|jgi:hypothetical protein|uniref:T9SS type A sorting domain-containing protein n=1 Tax=Chryseobacterium sp. TaxID=1871047 RepID=UPI00281D2DAC|nr:T9SS type A sorting domain-containing protein [Chryseobacterium sp.]MDR2237717.1 T9SS type A sorting domain-containing protein [Chryseobacterium sp.]
MKKFYSLVAAAVFAVSAFAQTTILDAPFNDLNGDGGNDGVWSGNVGIGSLNTYTSAGWAFASSGGARQCIKSGSGGAAGSVTTPVLAGLSGNATLTFRAAAYGTDNTNLSVTITGGGSLSGTSTFTLTKSTFSTYTVNIMSGTSSTKIKFASSGSNRRFFIDDIKVVTQATLAVNDSKVQYKNFIKNTSVTKEIYFGEKAEVKIYNTNGQLVKSASVAENGSLNVEDLQTGIYVVTGNVNGKAVSEKVIKK